jgi:hypothetical protein
VTATDAGLVMRTRAAKILTEVFAPPILVLTLLLVWAFTAHRVSAGGLLLGAVATLFAAGLPYAIMLVGIRRDRLSDRHLSPRTEPPVMMIIGPCVRIGRPFGDGRLDAPRELFALVAVVVAGIGVALAISSFWKISIHAACAAGTVAILVIVFGWIMLAWVSWSRLSVGPVSLSGITRRCK